MIKTSQNIPKFGKSLEKVIINLLFSLMDTVISHQYTQFVCQF